VNPRGPDHLHAQPNAEVGDFPAWVGLITHITGDAKYHPAGQTAKRPEIVVWHEDYIAAMDNLGFCMFTYSFFYPEHFARYLSAATGLSFSSDDVQLMGRRTLNLERAFNYREGYRREMDTLPRRMLDEVRGPYKLTRDELEGMLQGYYALHGWDPVSGAPTVETLERLGLGEFASFADTPSTTATR
jgi:aldehyde:ferredoxin oxidoreductase